MAGSFGDYAENKVLDHAFGKGSWTMPTTIALALSTTTPTDAGGNITEPSQSGTAYVRKSLTIPGDWNSAASGTISNVNDITFATATGAGWGTVTYVCIMDNATYGGGNMIAYASLSVSKTVSAGDTLKFTGGTPGDLQFSLD